MGSLRSLSRAGRTLPGFTVFDRSGQRLDHKRHLVHLRKHNHAPQDLAENGLVAGLSERLQDRVDQPVIRVSLDQVQDDRAEVCVCDRRRLREVVGV